MTSLWSIRLAVADDLPFVFNSWLLSARPQRSEHDYFATYKPIVRAIVSQSRLLVACSPEDEAQIFAYLVYNLRAGQLVIHYVYTKHPFRRLGVAKALVLKADPDAAARPIVVTATFRGLKDLAKRHRLSYVPYMALSGAAEVANGDRDDGRIGV